MQQFKPIRLTLLLFFRSVPKATRVNTIDPRQGAEGDVRVLRAKSKEFRKNL